MLNVFPTSTAAARRRARCRRTAVRWAQYHAILVRSAVNANGKCQPSSEEVFGYTPGLDEVDGTWLPPPAWALASPCSHEEAYDAISESHFLQAAPTVSQEHWLDELAAATHVRRQKDPLGKQSAQFDLNSSWDVPPTNPQPVALRAAAVPYLPSHEVVEPLAFHQKPEHHEIEEMVLSAQAVAIHRATTALEDAKDSVTADAVSSSDDGEFPELVPPSVPGKPHVRGDFRTMPPLQWQNLHQKFVQTRTGTCFTAIEIVLIIKDFLIAIETLLDEYGIDVTERCVQARRFVEECYLEEQSGATAISPEATRSATEVTELLCQTRASINDLIANKHGVELDAAGIDVHDWLRVRRRMYSTKTAVCVAPRSIDGSPSMVPGLARGAGRNSEKRQINTVTPAWTGLQVSRRAAGVASTIVPSINRHGGVPSTRAPKKRRDKPKGLERDSKGEHRPV